MRFVDNKIPFMAKSFTQQTFCVLLGSWLLLLHKYSPRFGLISHLVCQPKTLTSLSKCIQFSLIASAQPSQGISIASPTWRNFFFFGFLFAGCFLESRHFFALLFLVSWLWLLRFCGYPCTAMFPQLMCRSQITRRLCRLGNCRSQKQPKGLTVIKNETRQLRSGLAASCF